MPDSTSPGLQRYAIITAWYDREDVRMDAPKKHQTFRLGDTVRILSGPFSSFTGKIEGINQSKALLLVEVAIYGRTKPIRLNYSQVEVVTFRDA